MIYRSEDNRSCEPNKRKVLFGTEPRVQIPPLAPTDFGIKTRNSYLSPTFGSPGSGIQTKDLPVTEMELSEDYTCVISHGPNPRTTHIFDNCVVESIYE
ncbi:RNA-directed DNA polymerase (Reverse transcriptase), Ribonuclease H [Hibiscus syriacus]|uniref:RNA-directed DNA polymerase (Reverse transcriptase), Ribonuclease H n=2 Tax=Hibiscus syriacus TaxID=106335 RepID=A0A6A3BJD5_HIBSY|nr:RNA-directed DNA polymerase (Reverse transcriptase), Ribonuclease H [Hibiscus syriacus]